MGCRLRIIKREEKSSSRKTGLRVVSGLVAGVSFTAAAIPIVTDGTRDITVDYPNVISAGVHQDVFNYGFYMKTKTTPVN